METNYGDAVGLESSSIQQENTPQETASEVARVNRGKGVVVSDAPEFLDPLIHQPPIGVDMWVMPKGGIPIRSRWQPDFLAWCPLPNVPSWLKERLSQAYFGKRD